jgi:mannose-6-phosphate isomerase
LVSVINEHPKAILGRAVNEKYKGQLPLLVKFIDAQRDLSIQVHPNDEMAQREHGKMGKSEMWYVIKATPDAHLYAGFKQHIDAEEYRRRIADGTITEVLADHRVKAGDVFYLPAGRVHAICGGILLAEVQQSSDVTYRIYDYNRPGLDGKPRELHTELAAQALDYEVERNYRTDYPQLDNRAVLIVDSPYFSVRVLEFNDRFHRNLLKYDSFIITMCIEGDCEIRLRPSASSIFHLPSSISPLILKAGHSALIPAAIADYDLIPLRGKSRILDAFIDNRPTTLSQQITQLLHIER